MKLTPKPSVFCQAHEGSFCEAGSVFVVSLNLKSEGL